MWFLDGFVTIASFLCLPKKISLLKLNYTLINHSIYSAFGRLVIGKTTTS